MTATDSALRGLYGDLDRQLAWRVQHYPRRPEPEWTRLRETLDAVAAELWARRGEECAPNLDVRRTAELDAFAERPVFIGGYYKSGTTLLMNLLDGHHDLTVLPGEDRHFTGFVWTTAHLDLQSRIRELQRAWIQNTITPFGIPPHWILGRPWEDGRDDYAAFSGLLNHFAQARKGRDLLAAVAQAFSVVTRASSRQWAVKTPTLEFHIDRITSAYPDARFLHVVRSPRNAVSSILAYDRRSPIADPLTAAAELARSLRIAHERQQSLAGRYLVVHYEELVRETERCMREVAQVLEIVFDESLLAPTSGGRPATANAGRPERRIVGAVRRASDGNDPTLGRRVQIVVDALAGPDARELGYDTPSGSRAVRVVARALLWYRYRIRRH